MFAFLETECRHELFITSKTIKTVIATAPDKRVCQVKVRCQWMQMKLDNEAQKCVKVCTLWTCQAAEVASCQLLKDSKMSSFTRHWPWFDDFM